jgi:hypothetical protein
MRVEAFEARMMRRSPMTTASVSAPGEPDDFRHMWIVSEKASDDLGEEAIRRWVRNHWWGYLRARWLEHLQGKRFWVELDRGDFGLLLRKFHDHSLLLDRILDRIKAGQEPLEIILWAVDWGIPTRPVLEILEALDVNSRRLLHRFGVLDVPDAAIDPDWLAWEGGLVRRLAQGIDDDKAFDRLPILGDALEEAGCVDPVILEHCRSASRTAFWSWVVDRILGRY